MTNPLISVIIPVYNASATLDRCLRSIINQKMPGFEVLLIDDGSSDGSDRLCDIWAEQDARIKAFHQANGGVSAARNTGLAMAQGKWVCFIDADDCIEGDYLPDHFDDTIDLFLQNERMGETDLYQKLNVPVEGETLPMPDFLLKYAHTNLFRGICSKFCKMAVVREFGIRFDTTQRFQEDVLFFLQYVQHGQTVRLLPGGRYIYYTDSGWIQKYLFSREEAYHFFETFIPIYKQLESPLPKLARNIFSSFEELANSGEKIPLSWKLHPAVLTVKRFQIPVRNWRYRISCDVARVLSLFYPKTK